MVSFFSLSAARVLSPRSEQSSREVIIHPNFKNRHFSAVCSCQSYPHGIIVLLLLFLCLFNSVLLSVCQPPTGQRLCQRQPERETERETGTEKEKETGGKTAVNCQFRADTHTQL